MDFYIYCIFSVFVVSDLMKVVSGVPRCPRLSVPNGRATVRARGRTIQFRCMRGYTRIGAKMAICLKTNQWSQKPPMCVGNGCPELAPVPSMTTKKTLRGGLLQFTCAAGSVRQGPERIYCTGSKWNAKPPVCKEGISLGCDFEEESLCGWNQALTGDKLDWVWHQGATPTKGTGPKVDHTLGTSQGHYLFIESSAPSKNGQSAKLVSPLYQPSSVLGMCVEFFYHIFGADKQGHIGTLKVFLKPSIVPILRMHRDKRVTTLFEIDTNKGDEWFGEKFPIPAVNQPFQFVFEGQKLLSWKSDIAIDDIRLYNCSDDFSTAVPTTTNPPTTTSSSSTTSTTSTTTTTSTISTTSTTPPTTTSTAPMTTTTTASTSSTTIPPTTTTQTTTRSTTTMPTTTQPPSTTITTKVNTETKSSNTRITQTSTPDPTTQSTTKGTSIQIQQNSARTQTSKQTPQNEFVTVTTAPDALTSKSIYGTNTHTSYVNKHSDITSEASLPTNSDPSREKTVITTRTESSLPTNSPDNAVENQTSVNSTNRLKHDQGPNAGQSKDNSPSTASQNLLPLIIGVAAGVFLIAAVIAFLGYKYSSKKRVKKERETEDQMNIMSEYVDTNRRS